MRNAFAALLTALAASFFLVPEVQAQRYPVVEEFGGVNFMEYFVNGGSPIGDTDLEVNCRPSGDKRSTLLNFDFEDDGRLKLLLEDDERRKLALEGDESAGIPPWVEFVGEGERQRTVNDYFSCIGLRQFDEPENFGCSSIKTLFRYLEMFQPNHPSPDRARWSDMDQELYSALYALGSNEKKYGLFRGCWE